MKFNEYLDKYMSNLTEDEKADLTKMVQGETDAVRTDYTKQIKELEQYKPKEKTETEKALEAAQNELNQFKFEKTCKEKGIDANLAQYLKSDVDLDAFTKVYQTAQQSSDNFVPNSINTVSKELSKSDFEKMDYTQRMSLYNENPELYSQLNS